jgi:uncharacterized membrane protein
MQELTSPPSNYDAAIFERRLRPHRSLDGRGFRALLMAFCACGFFSSLPFVVLGAWPVAGFMGLDVLLLYVAFRANFGAARAYEDIRVTALEVRVDKTSARGALRRFLFNPLFTRLEQEEIEEFGVTRLDLVARGRRCEVAAFLGPEAKGALAGELRAALLTARRGPDFSR